MKALEKVNGSRPDAGALLRIVVSLAKEYEGCLLELDRARDDRRALEDEIRGVEQLLDLSPEREESLAQGVREALDKARRTPTAGDLARATDLAALAGSRWGRLIRLSNELTAIAAGLTEGPLKNKLDGLALEAAKKEDSTS